MKEMVPIKYQRSILMPVLTGLSCQHFPETTKLKIFSADQRCEFYKKKYGHGNLWLEYEVHIDYMDSSRFNYFNIRL